MASDTKCCTFNRGKFFIGDYVDPCDGLAPLGCPPPKVIYILTANIEIDYDVFGRQNKYHQKYNECARSQIANISLSLTIGCSDNENLSDFLLSQTTEGVLGSEEEVFYNFCHGQVDECRFISLNKTNIVQGTLVLGLYDSDGALIRLLVDGTDYTYEDRMIQFLLPINDVNAERLLINYDYNDTSLQTIDALKADNKPKSLIFRGTNFADGESSIVDVEIYKFSHTPSSDFEIIQDGSFLTLTLQGTIDKFYAGSGEDCYFKITKGDL